MTTIELWSPGIGLPGAAAARARRLESEGWTGIGIVDSQNLSGDTYVALAMAGRGDVDAAAGDRRHEHGHPPPRGGASAAASVQAESGGRLVLGIGRGDSALAHLGLAPAPVAQFEHYLRAPAGLPAARRGAVRPRHRHASSGMRSSASLGDARRSDVEPAALAARPAAEGARRRRRLRAPGDRRRRPPRRRRDVRRRRRSRSAALGRRHGRATRAGAGLDVDWLRARHVRAGVRARRPGRRPPAWSAVASARTPGSP